MKITIFLMIFTFAATSIVSKPLSLCLKIHSSEEKTIETFTHNDSCHTSSKEEKEKQLCVECDCYSNNGLNNYLSVIQNNFFETKTYRLHVSKYSFTDSLIDPPPRKVSL